MTQLTKGANVAVPSDAVNIVVTWTAAPQAPTVDLSTLLVTATGKVRDDSDFVFYNAPQHASGAVRLGPSSPGSASVEAHLTGVEDVVERIVVVLSADGGPFSQVPGLTVRVDDATSGQVVAQFGDMGATSETALVAGELYRRAGAWKFRAVGQGWDSGLAGLATDFGISVDDAPEQPSSSTAPAATPASAPAPAPAALRPAEPSQGEQPGSDTSQPYAAPVSPTPAPLQPPQQPSAPQQAPLQPPHQPQAPLQAPLPHQAPLQPPHQPQAPQYEPLQPPHHQQAPQQVPSPQLAPPPQMAPPQMAPPQMPPAPQAAPSVVNLDKGHVSLRKGDRVSLTKTGAPPMSRVFMGLGWDPAKRGRNIDLDASVIAFDANGRELEIVWFMHKKEFGGAIVHLGDNLTGKGDGDDEVITLDLTAIPPTVVHLAFTINSYSGQKFTDVRNAYARLVDAQSGAELVRFSLSESDRATGVVIAALSRTPQGTWDMRAIGQFANGRTVKKLVKPAAQMLGL